jgi:RecA/RadA recombinase
MAAKKKVSKNKAAPAPSPKKTSSVAAGSKQAAIRELFGEFNTADHKVIAFGHEVPNTYELRRPSGVMQLDIDTGGGLPAGGCCCLSGPEGSGKTHLLYMYMAMHQRLYGSESALAFASLEAQFDFKRARQCGMKIRIPKRMIEQWRQERSDRGMPDYTKEEIDDFNSQIGEFVLLGGGTGEEVCETILGCVEKRIFGIIGVDSLNGLIPTADAEKEMDEEQKRAAHSTMMTKFFKHYIPLTNGLDGLNETTLVFIQQVRANSAKSTAPAYIAKYLKDWAIAGAWATRHFKLIDIHFWSGQNINRKIGGENVIVGKELKWDLDKGKAGTHDNIQGSTSLYYEGGIDPINTVIVTGTRLGSVRETSNGVIVYKDIKAGIQAELGRIPDINALRKMMAADFDFEVAVRREVLASAGVYCLYR